MMGKSEIYAPRIIVKNRKKKKRKNINFKDVEYHPSTKTIIVVRFEYILSGTFVGFRIAWKEVVKLL